jgi:hypothetical protein
MPHAATQSGPGPASVSNSPPSVIVATGTSVVVVPGQSFGEDVDEQPRKVRATSQRTDGG